MKLFNSVIASALCCFCFQAFADVAVIVHSSNNLEISDDDISRLFLGKNKSFPGGEKALPINLSSGDDVRVEFERKVLNKSGSQVKAYWSKLIFSGKAKPLKEQGSADEVLALVASTPDAISYVDASKVNGTVRVIKTFK